MTKPLSFHPVFMYLITSRTSSRQKLRILRSGQMDPQANLKKKFLFAYVGITSHIFDFKFTWNYSATSHGKRAVDGNGVTVKRLATDALVTMQMLFLKMQIRCLMLSAAKLKFTSQ